MKFIVKYSTFFFYFSQGMTNFWSYLVVIWLISFVKGFLVDDLLSF